MTIAPDREDLHELDWPSESDRAAEAAAMEGIYRRMTQRIERQQREEMTRSLFEDRDWYCDCSPSRGRYLVEHWGEPHFALYQPPGVYVDSRPRPQWGRGAESMQILMDEAPVVAYNRWEPDPEPSTELVLAHTNPPVPEKVEITHDWNAFLAQLACGVMASMVVGIVACDLVLAVLHFR